MENLVNSVERHDSDTTLRDFIAALELLGLADIIGIPGAYTCLTQHDLAGDCYAILPGTFTARELRLLFKYAAVAVAPETQTLAQAA